MQLSKARMPYDTGSPWVAQGAPPGARCRAGLLAMLGAPHALAAPRLARVSSPLAKAPAAQPVKMPPKVSLEENQFLESTGRAWSLHRASIIASPRHQETVQASEVVHGDHR